MESSDTIDNVKAKIDNMKAKIQDKEDQRPLSRPSLAKTACSRPIGNISDQFPTRGTPSDKSPPRMISVYLA
jgi:hypothetical protein